MPKLNRNFLRKGFRRIKAAASLVDSKLDFFLPDCYMEETLIARPGGSRGYCNPVYPPVIYAFCGMHRTYLLLARFMKTFLMYSDYLIFKNGVTPSFI